jgi:hypothetical protein
MPGDPIPDLAAAPGVVSLDFYAPKNVAARLRRVEKYVAKWKPTKVRGLGLIMWRSATSPHHQFEPLWGGDVTRSRYGDPGVYVPHKLNELPIASCGAGISVSPTIEHAHEWAHGGQIVPVLVFPENLIVPNKALTKQWPHWQPHALSKARAASVVVLELPMLNSRALRWLRAKGWTK